MSKDRMMELLRGLLKDSKRSARDLARILGVSQPTVTRMRRKLEKTGENWREQDTYWSTLFYQT